MKDLKNYHTQLYQDLQEELQLYSEMGVVPIRKVAGALQSVRDALLKIETYVQQHPFACDADEIFFFKTIKPLYVSESVYAVEVTLLQMKRPALAGPVLKEYYHAELQKVHEFFCENRHWYQYYLMEPGELDAALFLRGAQVIDVMLPGLPGADPAFSTNGDYLWARFMAMERVKTWLADEIGGFSENTGCNGSAVAKAMADQGSGSNLISDGFLGLKWTGDSINLVELGYGIWLTGQVNNGNISVSELIEGLERLFRVKIGKPHRRWQSIASRKRVGTFKYLDELKAALTKRLEEEWGK